MLRHPRRDPRAASVVVQVETLTRGCVSGDLVRFGFLRQDVLQDVFLGEALKHVAVPVFLGIREGSDRDGRVKGRRCELGCAGAAGGPVGGKARGGWAALPSGAAATLSAALSVLKEPLSMRALWRLEVAS